MADRGLSAGAIAALGAPEVEVYHLLRIDFSSPVYLTTAPYNITYDDSDGSQLYLSVGLLLTVPDITESLKIKPETIKISLSGATTASFQLLLLESKGADTYISKYIVDASPEGFLVFKGLTDSYTTTEDSENGSASVDLNIANHWSNWDARSGTYLSDVEQQRLYPGDLGLEYSKITDYFLQSWGITGGFGLLLNDSYYAPDYVLPPNPYGDYAFNYTSFQIHQFTSELANVNNLPDTLKLPIVYGQNPVKGAPIFRTITDVSADVMWVVYALAEGECEALVDITFDGISYTDAKISPYVTAYFKNGSATQAVEPNLDAASALWTSAHTLKGICYVAIKYLFNADIFQSGTDPQPLFEIKGKKLYDPRVGGAPIYSQNNALVLYDYLTETRFGKGISSAELDGIIAGANYCDTLVTDHSGGTPTSIKLFEFHGIIVTTESIKKNVEAILFTMRGHLPWISGKYTLVIERDDDTSVFTFDEDNISGKFNVSEAGVTSLANIMYYSVLDKEAGYQKLDVIAESATYLAEDGRELKKAIKNKYEDNRYRAQNRANTELKKTRQTVSVDMSCGNAEAMKLQTGQIVDIARTTQGWVNKEFRIISMKLLKNCDTKFTLNEYEPTVYDWSVGVEVTPPVNTTVPNPLDLVAPTALVLTSGTDALMLKDDGTIISRIKATWTASTSFLISGYNLHYQSPTDSEKIFHRFIKGKESEEGYIDNVEDGDIYTVYVASVNLAGIESSFVSDTELVIGKTEKPENVTGFIAAPNGDVVVFKWNQASDLDLAGYEIRYGKAGISSAWADKTPLTSVTRGTNVTSADVPPGTWDFCIRAVDTTGNYSALSASVTDVLVESLRDVISQVAQAPSWLGTLSNFVLHHTGKLVPQSQEADSLQGGNTSWDDDYVFNEFVHNPYVICEYEAPEIDVGFDDSARIWGSIDSVLGVGETIGVAAPTLEIDYKLSAGSYDGFESWSIGTKTLRYCKHKLVLDTDAGIAIITGFLPTVDQLEHSLSDANIAIGSSGTTITFSTPFHVAPRVTAMVIATTGVFAVISAITSTSFHVKLFTSSGATAGTINWEATGI